MTFDDVHLPHRLRLRVAEQGPADGPAVIMLHGFTDSWFSFSRVIPRLPSDARVIVPDQRGHGESDRPSRGYTMDDFADDVIALMDVLHVPTAVIAGHSMGSFVARRVAARVPGRVTGLLLVGAAPTADNTVVQSLHADVERLTDPVDRAFVRAFQESTIQRQVPAPFMERILNESGKLPADVWRMALAGMRAFAPADDAIRSATVVVGGDDDAVFSREEQLAMATQVRHAEVQLSPGIGHALHWEDPDRFVAALAHVMRSSALVRR